MRGWDTRFSDMTLSFDRSRSDFSPNRERCHVDDGLPSPTSLCVIGAGPSHVAVWADSHGVELSQALAESGIAVKQITYSGCAPSTGQPLVPSKANRPYCDSHNKNILTYLVSNEKINTVVLTAYLNSQPRVLAQQLSSVASVLKRAGKRVVVIGPFHYIQGGKTDIPTWLARGNSNLINYEGLPAITFKSQFPNGVDLIMPEEIFCSAGMCPLSLGNRSLFFDTNHPSMYAQLIVADRVLTLLQVPFQHRKFH